MLFHIYVATAIIGSILLGASLFLGDHDADVDSDVDLDADADVDVDADMHADVHVDAHGTAFSDFWLPFLSLRFWVFFMTFFGITGCVLSLAALAGRFTTLLSAIVIGSFSGFAAATIIRKLNQSETGGVTEAEDIKGLEGDVLLAVSNTERGRIRLTVGGTMVDMFARTDEQQTLQPGARVLVIDVKNEEAIVVATPATGGEVGE